VRLTWFLRWAIALLVVIALLILIDWIRHVPTVPWTERLVVFAVFIGGGLYAWFSLVPPVVRVTARYITCPDWPFRQRIRRSDIAYIFRGQAALGRYRVWQHAYFLVTGDGTPRITISAEDFTDDGMTALAKRLQVPIQGDFTAQVP
jgi:hypothetical protein